MRPEEIGDLLGTDPESVIVAREAALEQLASELGYYESDDLDDLRVRLTSLPGEAWSATVVEEERKPEAIQEPVRTRDEPPRKSRMPLLLALLAVAAVVLVIVLASSGGDDSSSAPSTPAAPQGTKKPAHKPAKKPARKPAPKPAPAASAVKLTPVAGASGASGSASLTGGGKRLHLSVSGLPAGSYEVWLYDSVIDARSIGKATGSKIALDAKLPADASNFRYIDVSREPADGNPNHSGESVLRLPLAKLSP